MNIPAKIKNLKRQLAKSRGRDPQDYLEPETEERIEREIENLEDAYEKTAEDRELEAEAEMAGGEVLGFKLED